MPGVKLGLGVGTTAEGAVLELAGVRFVAGRKQGCVVRLDSNQASREHAELRLARNGTWFVRDLDSRNGTWLNNHRVFTAELHPGDLLRFGEEGPVVRVLALDPAPATRPGVEGDAPTTEPARVEAPPDEVEVDAPAAPPAAVRSRPRPAAPPAPAPARRRGRGARIGWSLVLLLLGCAVGGYLAWDRGWLELPWDEPTRSSDADVDDTEALVREWLAVAEPPAAVTTGSAFAYDAWGRPVEVRAEGVERLADPPDANGRSPAAYAWDRRADLDSVDHGRLEEWVRAKRAGQPSDAFRGRHRRAEPTGVPFYLVCRCFVPAGVRDRAAGTRASDELATVDPKTCELRPLEEPVVFHVDEAGAATYAPKAYPVGTQFAVPVTLKLTSEEEPPREVVVTGALLLEVTAVRRTWAAVLEADARAGPDAAASRLLEVSRRDGRFTKENLEAGAYVAVVQGAPPVAGWPDPLREQSVRLLREVAAAFDCFLATAVYRAWDGPQLTTFRRFRDRVLATTPAGRRLIEAYGRHGPRVATWLRRHPQLECVVKPAFDALARGVAALDLDDPWTRWGLDVLVRVADGLRRCVDAAGPPLDGFDPLFPLGR